MWTWVRSSHPRLPQGQERRGDSGAIPRREEVRDRAADKLLKNAYLEALEESKLEPYAAADVEIVSFEIGEAVGPSPRVATPKVELGQYTDRGRAKAADHR